jgi:hypothetical protein
MRLASLDAWRSSRCDLRGAIEGYGVAIRVTPGRDTARLRAHDLWAFLMRPHVSDYGPCTARDDD